MPKCKLCGRRGLFLSISKDGLCRNCQQEVDHSVSKINQQIHQLEQERNVVLASSDLTPAELDHYTRSYHYKDVNVYVVWQYGGQYGKTCESIGIKRGQYVDLVPAHSDEDPEKISIYWHGIEIAAMKTNRLRSMVHQWIDNSLPILCVISSVGGEQKLLLEFAFYGKPSKNK